MEYTVYVLRSVKDEKRYVGMTENLERRLKQHLDGLVNSTKHRRPFRLVYTEKFNTKEGALKREKFFKSGKGREFLDQVEGA